MGKTLLSAAGDRVQDLPFALDEYQSRLAALRRVMAANEYDVLFVTSPPNLYYLTGYQALLYPPRLPIGALISADRVTLVDWERNETFARTRVLCDDVVLVSYANFAREIAQGCLHQGWRGRTIGIEWSTPTPVAAVMIALGNALGDAGLHVKDADGLLDRLTRYKSAAEIAYIRNAAAIADESMLTLQNELRPGLTHMQVSARLAALLADRGAEHAAMPPMVNAGPHASTNTLGFPSRRILKQGDLVSVDCCASVARYHVYLARTFVLGDATPPLAAALDRCDGALDVLAQAAALHAPTSAALAAAHAHVLQAVPERQVWWVGGYSLGAAFPPSWVGRDYLADVGPDCCHWRPGFVSNFEILLTDHASGAAAACIDTIVTTETGIEALSHVPRRVLHVGP